MWPTLSKDSLEQAQRSVERMCIDQHGTAEKFAPCSLYNHMRGLTRWYELVQCLNLSGFDGSTQDLHDAAHADCMLAGRWGLSVLKGGRQRLLL